MVLSRMLGPGGRGEISAAILWPTALVYLSSFGLISATVFYASQRNAPLASIVKAGILMGLAFSVLAIATAYPLLPTLLHIQRPEVVSNSRLFLLATPIGLLTQIALSTLQGQLRFGTVNLLRLINPLGYLVGVWLLIIAGALTAGHVVQLQLALAFIVFAAAMFQLRELSSSPIPTEEKGIAKSLWSYGYRSQIGVIAAMANQSLDQALMAALLPPELLGIYVVAISSAAIAQTVSLAIRMVLVPALASIESIDARRSRLLGAFRQYWALSLLAFPLAALALPIAIPLVFGARFSDAIIPAEVLLAGYFFSSSRDVLSGGSDALGDPILASHAQFAGLATTILLLAVLLVPYGVLGAAISTAGASLVQFITMVVGLRRRHKLSTASLILVNFSDIRAVLLTLCRDAHLFPKRI